MTWGTVLDTAGAVLLLAGALLCLVAAVGLVRFPDVLTRTHAATKPQTLGLLCAVAGTALWLRDWRAVGILVLVAVLQLLTIPVASHLVGRAALRSAAYRRDLTEPNELADDLTRAGFRPVPDEEPPAGPDSDPR